MHATGQVTQNDGTTTQMVSEEEFQNHRIPRLLISLSNPRNLTTAFERVFTEALISNPLR